MDVNVRKKGFLHEIGSRIDYQKCCTSIRNQFQSHYLETNDKMPLKKKRSDLILILCLKCVSIIFLVNILWGHFQVIKCVKIMSENINKGIVYDHYSLIERGKSYFSVFLGIFCLLVLFNSCANSLPFRLFTHASN